MAERTPWLIVGTVPLNDFPLFWGTCAYRGDTLLLEGGRTIPIGRGTTALLAATLELLSFLNRPSPLTLLVGDTGAGTGSKELYRFLCQKIGAQGFSALHGITFHYLFPDVDWHNRILLAIEEHAKDLALVADAGFMYAAKMSGYGARYTLFTPDAGELAFLADEKAPHPFYTRGFLLADQDVASLVQRAYTSGNVAEWLIVKGKNDAIIHKGEWVASVCEPDIAAMEAIGGTGDLVTGLATGLLAAGALPKQACPLAAKISRLAGSLAKVTPASQVTDILPCIAQACTDLSVAL